MTRLGRPAVLGGLAIGLLLAGLATWFLIRPSGPGTPAEYLTWFPDREAAVLYLDVGALRASGILDKLVGSTVGEAADYSAFIRQTGFDYKRDLDRVMLNSAGGIHYFVVQGRFDWPKLRAYAESQGGKCAGATYCQMKGSTPDRVISWRSIGDHFMGIASARDEAGARAIDHRSDAGKPPFDVPPAPLWLELPGDVIRANQQLPAGTRLFAKALEKSERVVFAINPDGADKFALTADVTCVTPEDAAVLRAQLDGLTKTLASFIAREKQTPSPADFSGILTSGQFERVDRHVKARWAVPRAFIDTLGGA